MFLFIVYNFSIGDGSWEISGVTTNSLSTSGNYTTLQCSSTHLTSFAVLVDVAGGLEVKNLPSTKFQTCVKTWLIHFMQNIEQAERKALQIVSYVGCAISILCLVLTILFFVTQGWEFILSMITVFDTKYSSFVQEEVANFDTPVSSPQPSSLSVAFFHCLCCGPRNSYWKQGSLSCIIFLLLNTDGYIIFYILSGWVCSYCSSPSLFLLVCILLDALWGNYALPSPSRRLQQDVKADMAIPSHWLW